MPDPGLFALLALAFAQVGQGQVAEATKTYEGLGKVGPEGASFTASGLADLAIYQGRFSDAERMLAQGAAADLTAETPDKAARKFATLAEVQLLRQQKAAAAAAAEKALSNSQAVKIRFLAARVFLEAGAAARAKTLAAGLAAELQAEPQAYASIIEGLTALHAGDARQAIKALTAANGLLDTWIGHFYLGRAYLEAGAFPQADSEFDRCIKRRGEALALFLDEEPTYGSFPTVYYYQGRVREGLKSTKFGGIVRRLSRHSRTVHRRSSRPRSPPARGCERSAITAQRFRQPGVPLEGSAAGSGSTQPPSWFSYFTNCIWNVGLGE